jgi:hypothetical protein
VPQPRKVQQRLREVKTDDQVTVFVPLLMVVIILVYILIGSVREILYLIFIILQSIRKLKL